MSIVEYQRGTYTLSTDLARLDLACIHDYLSTESYRAQGQPFEVTQRSVEHSLCFGIYHDDEQVAFARVVTDCATFAWLCNGSPPDGQRLCLYHNLASPGNDDIIGPFLADLNMER